MGAVRRLLGLLALALAWSCAAPSVTPPAPADPRIPAAVTARAPIGTGRLRVDFVAVGQGDAALVTSPVGKTVLIDGGPRQAADELVAFLRGRDAGPLDLVLLTHRHEDHLGGLTEVIERRGTRMFLDALAPPGQEHGTPLYQRLVAALERRRIPVRQAEAGRTIDLGGSARLVLLAPPAAPIVGSRSDVNANSVVARLEYGRVRVLFAADAEAATERWLLAQGADLRASVLKVAHHGSRHSSTPAFLDAVAPRVAVLSLGAGNRYRHPAPETLARLARANIRVYRTDVDGTITLETDGEALDFHTERPQNGDNTAAAAPLRWSSTWRPETPSPSSTP
jgi:beta-lactamase superfamily II metal-dependent hydrolase